MKIKSLFCLIIVFLVTCNGKRAVDSKIVIYCAASLTPVVEQFKNQWEKENNGKIIISSASSGTLARQLEYGAQADLFISANEDWMQYVIKSLELDNQPEIIATNKLAIITPLDVEVDSMNIDQILSCMADREGNISIGDPGHVPLGKYTKESLAYYSKYDEFSTRFILTKDARSALRLVELGEAEMGIVYLSDALSSDKVRIVGIAPEASHQKIVYKAIILNEKNLAAESFLALMTSEKSVEIWEGNRFRD